MGSFVKAGRRSSYYWHYLVAGMAGVWLWLNLSFGKKLDTTFYSIITAANNVVVQRDFPSTRLEQDATMTALRSDEQTVTAPGNDEKDDEIVSPQQQSNEQTVAAANDTKDDEIVSPQQQSNEQTGLAAANDEKDDEIVSPHNNLTIAAIQRYDKWVREKSNTHQDTCKGWLEYKEWVDALFDLAPPAPGCDVVENFRNLYNNSASFVEGTLVLSKNEQHNPVHSLTSPTVPMRGRQRDFHKMWNDANRLRKLPPNLEMLLYANDKPRVHQDVGLPAFVISGEFPVGSGMPTRWTNYLPFPSHFYSFKRPRSKDLLSFELKRPVVFFRGRFSENVWSRFKTHRYQCENTPRFKLALGTSNVADNDVLDIKLTGFGAVKEPLITEIKEALKRDYNITMGESVNPHAVQQSIQQSRYALGVSGNGWAGATVMRALLSGSCMLFVNDNSTDYENYTRNLGEIYFPLMKKDRDYVLVEYDNIADATRKLNANPDKAQQISEAGLQFAKKFLGIDCAMDVLEMLAWRYYKYVSMGCPSAFSHVKLNEFTFQR